jgi:hypothetical protein
MGVWLAKEAATHSTRRNAVTEIEDSGRRVDMASTLTITGCSITTNSITISFSDVVDQTSTSGTTSATNPDNYTVYDPAANFPLGTHPPLPAGQTIVVSADGQTVTIPLAHNFNVGDFVLIGITNIGFATNPGTAALIDDPVSISRQVPGKGASAQVTKDVEDAIAYPILTEEIGYRPSPVGIPTGGGGGIPSAGTSNLGQVALKAVSDVLGWKANPADPKGFIGALTQSFNLTDVEGHVEATWTPRTYAVQTDLGGGITGAQASLYTRAKDALDKALPLLDGLYPLDPEADPEYVKALREMVRSQMMEIVKELGTVGLPSILRIDTYFNILLGQSGKPGEKIEFEPDRVKGTLGDLRNTYGIAFLNNKLSNSVEDEQDITNFRMISDYMTSLLQSWISNRDFFRLGTSKPAFFGTQLVLISRQFNVITETVNELRFALDSVFIGPSERQTLLLEFGDGSAPMFLEDVLDEVESFAIEEGPRLLRDGGRISVTNNILPVVQSLQNLVEQAHTPTNLDELPDGFKTARVRNAIDDLEDQLDALISLIKQVTQELPPPEDKFTIDSLIATDDFEGGGVLSIIGEGFDADAAVEINSAVGVIATPDGTDVFTQFFSAERIDVVIQDSDLWNDLQSGSHTITVINQDGESVSVTAPNGITPDANGIQISAARFARAQKPTLSGNRTTPSVRRRRPTMVTVGGKPVGPPAAQTTPTSGAARASSAATNSSATAASTVAASSAPATDVTPQLTALQTKHDEIRKDLAELKDNHSLLAQTLTAAQTTAKQELSNQIAQMQKNHESILQKLEGFGSKLADFFEKKDSEKKDKKS